MKKTVMLAAIFCWLLVTGASAQWSGGHDYEPFLVEGKTWLYHEYNVNLGGERTSDINEITYTVLGDTLVEELDCKKIRYYNKGEQKISTGVAYEKDKKVYSVNQTGDTTLIFDFDMNVGDTLLQMTMDEYSEITEVTGLIDFHNNGNQYQGIVLETFYETNGRLTEVSPYDTLIVGVGYSEGIDPINYMGSCVRRFVSCTWPDGRQYVTEYGKKYLEEQDKDYEPFIVEGKEWLCEWEHGITGDKRIERYMLQGDTVIDGVVWKKMYENGVCYRVWREENKKIYALSINDSGSVPELMYDFNLSVDDTLLTINHTDTDNYACYRVKSQDTIVQNDCTYHLQTIHFYLVQDGEKNELSEVLWIEGVGSEFCPTMNLPYVGNPTTLISCTWPDGRQYVTEYGKKYLEEQDKDYEPFLVEGKEWRVHSRGGIGLMTDLNEYYKIDGDTLVGDRTYKKVYCHEEGTIDGKPVSSKEEPSYLMYEDGRKVYYVVTGKDNDPKLLYDFGLNPDESFGNTDYVLERIDTVAQSGQDYAKYSLTTSGQNTVTWIEGVGSTIDLLCSTEMLVGATMDLVSCTWPDGRQYITEYGKKYLEGIHSIKNEEMNNTIYDLQGRRVENPKQGEIYIQNGKKYINK